MTGSTFAGNWSRWHEGRLALAKDPYGPTSLAATHWLGSAESSLDGVPGRWRAAGSKVRGTGLALAGLAYLDGTPAVGTDGELVLESGQEVNDVFRRLRAFERDGSPALRIFDPQRVETAGIQGIDAYSPDPAWSFRAVFEAGGQEAEVMLVDGHTTRRQSGGTAVFTHAGREHRLQLGVAGKGFSAVFGDATNGVETYGFRFLNVPAPGPDGVTTVDFNRAYLPPCAFSNQFACPLPPAENRFGFPIPAGEKSLELTRAAIEAH